jgi:hypothetical protein
MGETTAGAGIISLTKGTGTDTGKTTGLTTCGFERLFQKLKLNMIIYYLLYFYKSFNLLLLLKMPKSIPLPPCLPNYPIMIVGKIARVIAFSM